MYKALTYTTVGIIAGVFIAYMIWYARGSDDLVAQYGNCQMTIKGVSGKLCQQRDNDGIYYTNGKIKVTVMK